MLLPNNPEINVKLINEKLESVRVHRRRLTPLLLSLQSAAVPHGRSTCHKDGSIRLSARSPGVRGLIKAIPVIGGAIVYLYRRKKAICAPGLQWKQRLRLVPVIGSLAAWTYSLVKLNAVRSQIASDLVQLRHRQVVLEGSVEQMNARLTQIESLQLGSRLGQIESQQLDQRLNSFENLQLHQRLAQVEALEIDSRLNQLDQTSRNVTTEIKARDNRVAALTRELRRLSDAVPSRPLPVTVSTAHASAALRDVPVASEHSDMDSFYVEFEDAFRGTAQDIAKRLEVYLPYLAKFSGDADGHVVDVGCGRGEWLGLLRGHNIKATGVDLNAAMVDACLVQGLQAQSMDAIEYLRQQPEASLAAVTGFHIMEHLPLKVLLELFDAALHALRPDGLIIFETPNPENLVVGACNFYYDPTHLNPIVPAVAQFMAVQRGFAKAEILRLHPFPVSHRLIEDSEVAKRLNQALYGPQDYALLAWKTHAN